MDNVWERRPLYISRNAHKGYYDGFLSKANIDEWLRGGALQVESS
jgi:lysine-specific demethylase/histidyl-hydroxylase NO66